ncbi:MAG: Gamma-glutamyl-L-1-hydroxyisopropylamide hydrolase [Alphaproteobacteria bacterium UBA4588]|nr:MAG: Gamma-glutamyl-L-1-hydroxyisopropylamide hydrolase [Alphaproteobacteria bacterium UBA4588]
MKIGILEAGQNNAKMDPRHPQYATMFTSMFAAISAPLSCTAIAVKDGIFPESVDTFDGYLITGSACGVYDDEPWINQLIFFVREAHAQKIPLMGICFGHQLLAHALGGWAEKSEKGWGVGERTVDIKTHAHWMHGDKNTVTLIYFHQDQVTKLPPEATCIAGDTFCPNAIFAIDDTVFSVQGHPEFSADYSRDLLTVLTPKVGDEQTKTALASLNNTTDDSVVADWIQAFFCRPARYKPRHKQ